MEFSDGMLDAEHCPTSQTQYSLVCSMVLAARLSLATVGFSCAVRYFTRMSHCGLCSMKAHH